MALRLQPRRRGSDPADPGVARSRRFDLARGRHLLIERSPTEQMIRSEQRAWADARGVRFDRSDRVDQLEDNLFQAMNPETRPEFEAGDGGELGNTDAP